MKKKNFLLTFMCACVPGCGQMYHGYMKRGLSLLFWACAILMAAVLLNLGVLAVLIGVVWAYSFFDTFNIRNLTPEQQAAFYDDYIPSQRWMKENHLETVFRSGRGAKVAGWVLIAIGVITLYNNFLGNLIRNLRYSFPFINTLYYALPRLVVGLGIIAAGLWLIRHQGEHKGRKNDDIVQYLGEHKTNTPGE